MEIKNEKKWKDIKCYSDVRELSIKELKDYIEYRITNANICTSSRGDEEPEDFVINAFKNNRADASFEKLCEAVEQLLSETPKVLLQQEEFPLLSLLYIVEYFRISKCGYIVLEMVVRNINFSLYTERTSERLVRTLAGLQRDREHSHINYFNFVMENPKSRSCVQAAFTGLRFCGLDYALNALPVYANIVLQSQQEIEEYLRKLSVSLVSLITQYRDTFQVDGEKEVIKKIIKSVKKCTQEKKEIIFNALCLSSKIEKDYMRIIECLKK